MLYLKPPYYLINGVTLFRDHEDPLQWYFLPVAPHLTMLEDPTTHQKFPQFQLIKYRGRAGNGGFLNFDVNLGVSDEALDDLRREIRSREHLTDDPRLAPALLEDGTVKLMLFGKESGSEDEEDNPNAQFVLKIDHHAKPALYGDNQAAFSVQLDQEGVTVLEKAIQGEMTPIGVVYSLDYLALRPAYNVRLTVDWDRVQTHMQEHFGVNTLVFSADIDKVVDELIENRSIVLEADTFVPEGDEEDGVSGRRDQALNQVREMITDAFFTPSLDPYQEKEDGWDKAAGFVERIGQIHANGGQGALFNYSKLDYTRIDRKSLNVAISERTTVKRSIYPQGHLSGLFRAIRAEGLDPADFILEVDLDDPWFERRRVKVIARADWEADGISSINVNLRYGNQPKNVILDAATSSAELEWLSILRDNAMVRDVTVDYTVTFKSTDGGEHPSRLSSQRMTFVGDNLEVDPRADGLFTLGSVPIIALNFPWQRYPVAEVHLRYSDPANQIRQSDSFLLREESAEARFVRFMRNPDQRTYDHQVILRAANHEDIEGVWQTGEEDQIVIRDPFPRKRALAVVPSFAWDEVDRAFVDLSYDGANDQHVEASFEFSEPQAATQTFVVDLEDPTQQAISYRATILFKDGRVVEIPPSVTRQPRLILSTTMRGHRIIQVIPPDAATFAARRLRSVELSLRYSDAANRIGPVADNFTFVAGSPPQFFEFDFADPARQSYSYSVKYTFTNNLTKTIPEKVTDSAVLLVPAP